jgi:hypothetical protein
MHLGITEISFPSEEDDTRSKELCLQKVRIKDSCLAVVLATEQLPGLFGCYSEHIPGAGAASHSVLAQDAATCEPQLVCIILGENTLFCAALPLYFSDHSIFYL